MYLYSFYVPNYRKTLSPGNGGKKLKIIVFHLRLYCILLTEFQQ